MTTATAEEQVYLPWDYFLTQTSPSDFVLASIDGYRRAEWKSSRQKLLKQYRWSIPEGMEPHWVAPQKAVYWQEKTTYKREFVSNVGEKPMEHTASNIDVGHWRRVKVGEGEWAPTGPLPAHAGAIAHYLNKGFRLRPPVAGVTDAIKRESADLLEVASENTKAEPKFFCYRHGEKKMGFTNWDGYLKHCVHYGEHPAGDPPKEVLAKAANFVWYCVWHDVGFNKRKGIEQHYKSERKRPGGHNHPTVEDMLVDKGGMKK